MKNCRQFSVLWSRTESSPCPAREFRKSPKFPRQGKDFHRTEGTRVQGNPTAPPHSHTALLWGCKSQLKAGKSSKTLCQETVREGGDVIRDCFIVGLMWNNTDLFTNDSFRISRETHFMGFLFCLICGITFYNIDVKIVLCNPLKWELSWSLPFIYLSTNNSWCVFCSFGGWSTRYKQLKLTFLPVVLLLWCCRQCLYVFYIWWWFYNVWEGFRAALITCLAIWSQKNCIITVGTN